MLHREHLFFGRGGRRRRKRRANFCHVRHSLPFFDVVARRRLLLRFISVRRRRRERIGIRNGFQASSCIHSLPMRMKQRGRATTKSFSFEQPPRVLQNKGRRRGGHSNDAAGEQSRRHSCKPRVRVCISLLFLFLFFVRERTVDII